MSNQGTPPQPTPRPLPPAVAHFKIDLSLEESVAPIYEALDASVAAAIREHRAFSPGTALAVMMLWKDSIAKVDPVLAEKVHPAETSRAAMEVGRWRPFEPVTEPMED